MTRCFEGLSELQQCTFILVGVVTVGTKQITASPVEDLARLTLVETLWETRFAAVQHWI